MICTVQKFTLETDQTLERSLQVKKFLKSQQVWNFGIGNSHSSTMSYMTYYPMILRRQLLSEGKHLNSTIMLSHKHYIADRKMGSCFIAFHTKRHMKPSGKLTMVCAELTNLDLNLKIDSEDLATSGQRWFLLPSPMLSGVTVRFMVTSSIKHQDIFTQRLLHVH